MNKSKVIADLKKLQQKCMDTSNIETEEATKHSLILPMLSALGYDIFDNNEVRPEYVADVGTKKGEKVDYVILQNGQPTILIEAKQVGTPLKNKTDQLFRYFVATTAKIAILTDGVKYLFYTDSQKTNIMDDTPYMAIDMSKATEDELERLLDYHKEQLNIGDVIDNIKYDQYTEVSKKFIEDLLEMRPANWLIRKLAEDCQITEPDDVKLAEILNNQLASKLGIKKLKKMSTPKPEGEDNKLGNRTAKLTDEVFKNTKGMKVTTANIAGHIIEKDRIAWTEIYRYIFTKCTEPFSQVEIWELFNKRDSRKFVYRSDNCDEDQKKKYYHLEEKDLYVDQCLAGRDIVYRCIETCKIFGGIDADSIEIHYEIEAQN